MFWVELPLKTLVRLGERFGKDITHAIESESLSRLGVLNEENNLFPFKLGKSRKKA